MLCKAVQKPSILFDLEKDEDVLRLQDASFVFEQYKDHCIILDEVQRMPKLFTLLRPVIDNNRQPGRFLLTGSASPDLVKGVSESLAGRIAFVELTPITLPEALSDTISMQQHWFRGGFPGALTASSNAACQRWLSYFIRTYIEKDLSQLFGVRLSETLIRNFWYMLAGNNGSILNLENYARSLGVSSTTVKSYLAFLEAAFLVRQLPSWSFNSNKRLIKSPKTYVRDSGILHVLNRVSSPEKLPLDLSVGASWEGYVIEQIAACKPPHIEMYYYRTQHGAECDLVLTDGLKPVAAIEIKYSNKPSPSKGLYEAMQDLGLEKSLIVVPEGDNYNLNDKIRCLNIVNLLEEIANF